MPRSNRVHSGLAITLGVACVCGGLAMAVPLTWPTTWPLDLPPSVAVSEARAVRATAAVPADLAEVRRQTLKTLAERPTDSTAWARLAWVAAEEGDLEGAREALDKSYVAAPYGPEITGWRLRFAFGMWGWLTPDLRRQALSELSMTAKTRPGVVRRVRADVVDPAGRWAIDLTLAAER